MSTKNQVYELKKELAFWERVHEYEGSSNIEDRLERQILQLENRNEFGEARYNGYINNDHNDDYRNDYTSQIISCRYCGKRGLKWVLSQGRWRLAESNALHSCDAYKNRKNKNV